MSWSYGYFTDLDYSHGYYPEMSPAMLRLVCLAQGIVPQLRDEPTYLELGFGQGISINIHAAGSAGSYWGTDFNPGQAVEAMRLAAASGADLHLFDQSFEEFAARDDLPDFDIIALHGIWSWISPSNRQVITSLIRRKLRPGGIVYISYNCLPGWAPIVPIRELMALYRDYGAAKMAGPVSMIDGAMRFTEEIVKADSLYFKENPAVKHHLEKIASQSQNYLAHEYLNADWHLDHFADMARSLNEAKLSFVGSARLLDGIDGLQLTDAGRKLISQIAHPVMRETARDYLMNRRFRCDVFTKGAHKLLVTERRDAWQSQAFVLVKPPADMPKKIPCGRGEAELPADKYDPVISVLSASHFRSKSVGELVGHPELQGYKPQEIIEVLMVLVGAGWAAPAREPSAQERQRCRALNEHILQRALVSMELHYMVSPVTGGGINLPHMAQLFIHALEQGPADAATLANYVWRFLDTIGERLLKDDKRVESKEENIAMLRISAKKFLTDSRPLLEALQIIGGDREPQESHAARLDRLGRA